jgi:integration host factor subunit alpha
VSRKLSNHGKTKADLIDAVYRRHGALTKGEAAEIVDVIFQTVKTTLQDGRSVKLRNFGSFEVTQRSGRKGVNPASGEKMFIPPHTGLTFRPSRNLKSVLTDEEGGES